MEIDDLSGYIPEHYQIKVYDYVFLTQLKQTELVLLGIPHTSEWFMAISADVSGLFLAGLKLKERIIIGWDEPVITSVKNNGMGSVISRPSQAKTGLMDQSNTIVNTILAREGITDISEAAFRSVLVIVGDNPGAARAASALIKKAGTLNVTSKADVERILGIIPNGTTDQLEHCRKNLWAKYIAQVQINSSRNASLP